MSDEQQSDKSDALNAHEEALSPKQKKFLKAYRQCGVIKYACQIARIHRSTFYEWRDTNEDFKICLVYAQEDAHDVLEYSAHEQAVTGIFEPLVSAGQPVYEQIPVLDEDGKPVLDSRDRPVVKRGKLLTKRVLAPSLLQTLLKANLPEKYKDKQSVELTGKDGQPVQFQHLQHLSEQELDTLEQIALNAQERVQDGK